MNAAVLMIVILNYLEIDTKVSNADMETVRFYDCREVSGDNGYINGVLAAIWERAKFSCKDRQKFMNIFT